MPDGAVVTGKTVSIREAGYDEHWLQDRIVEDPSCLTLGELEVVAKERRQASGGRLDILLKDTEDDTMYEVEVMLGETDETHIVRTLEYWDVERRRWPTRQHFAVLVAESVTRRFANVIQLLGNAVPVIAIQASLIEAAGSHVLHFTKVLDTYVEPEDAEATSAPPVNENYWRERASWTVDAAKALLEIVGESCPDAKLRFVQAYIRVDVGREGYFWLNRRSQDRSRLVFWVTPDARPEVEKLLDAAGLDYDWRKENLRMKITLSVVREKADAFREVVRIVRRCMKD